MNIQNKLKISLGFLLILFDYNKNLGSLNFSLFPTFLGFLLLFWGTKEIAEKSEFFGKLRMFSIVCTPIFFIIYIINMFGILNKLQDYMAGSSPANPVHISNTENLFLAIQLILNTILILCVVFATYLYACGCRQIANNQGTAIGRYGRQFFNTFQIYCALRVLYLIIYALYIFTDNTLSFAMPIFSLCGIVASVVYISQGHRIYEILFPAKPNNTIK